MVVATMTQWSEARTFYSFCMCFGLVLYWMILDLYWTCGELDVLLQGFCNILNLELFWRLPVWGGRQNNHYIKNIQYIHRLTDAFIHMAHIFVG
jgi:hypothetical protein